MAIDEIVKSISELSYPDLRRLASSLNDMLVDMDRKIEVGATYRLPDVTVHNTSVEGDRVRVAFDATNMIYGFDSDWFAAHATLVKAAERQLAVGEAVKWSGELWTILAINGSFAWLKSQVRGDRQVARLTDLRRAETT